MQKIRLTDKFDKKSKQVLMLYAAAFLIPLLSLYLMRFYFLSGHGNLLSGALSPSVILLNALAGTAFLFYIRKTVSFSLTCVPLQLLFACSYGLCCYGIVQESYLPALCLYAVFPLLYLSFEQMNEGKHYLPFIVLMSAAFMLQPESAVPAAFLLLLYSIAGLHFKSRLSLGSFAHGFSCMLLAFLLGAFRIFPYLESMRNASYTGFALSYPFPMFLSRFLPFGSLAVSFSASYGLDLYFGSFALLPFFLFFTNRSVSGSKRLIYGVLTLLTMSVVVVSPIRHLFSMGISNDRYTVYFSFLLVFWMLRLAGEGAAQSFRSLPVSSLVSGLLLTLGVILISYACYRQNFTGFALPVTLLLLLCSALPFSVISYKKTDTHPVFVCTCLLTICALSELIGNAFSVTNLNLLPRRHSMSAAYVWDGLFGQEQTGSGTAYPENTTLDTAQTQSGKMPSPANADAYQAFADAHSESEEMETISLILKQIQMDDGEYTDYCGTTLPNFFELVNGLARKAGADADLFEPVSATITFEDSEDYTIVPVSDSLYFFQGEQSEYAPSLYYVAYSMETQTPLSEALFVQNDSMNEIFALDSREVKEPARLYTSLRNGYGSGLVFQLNTYTLNRQVYDQIPALLEQYQPESQQGHSALSGFLETFQTYLGFILSCIGLLIFLSLYFNSDRQQVYDFLSKGKSWLDARRLPNRLKRHFAQNRMYYLAFAIPFLLFLTVMVITDSTPFGIYSLFSEDGAALTVPSYMDIYYNLKQGNRYFSLNGGFGYSLYSSHPLIQTMLYFRLLCPEQIPALLLFGVAICMGFCGLGMVYYMTHRLLGGRATKTDYRLLVPAMLYSVNAYMLSMHNFTGWFYTLMAFPLLICALEHLLYKKRTLPYVLLLTYCIATNLYLALYMCIFLVLYFFTCHFRNGKDFIIKGIRFALCSLLAAGNAFFVITSTLLGSADSPYRDTDSVLPAFGLHTNFLKQWKQHMLFNDIKTVSSDNGFVSLYCGIAALLLMILYFSCRQISLRVRLRKLIPIIILYVSFNGVVLSYLWNGLHYQSKVPNRYVFILMFLIAELSYDILRHIGEISRLHFLLATVILCVFFSLCHFGSREHTLLSYAASLAACAAYLLCHLLFAAQRPQLYPRLFTLLLTAELIVNTVYSFTSYSRHTLMFYGNYVSIHDYLEEASGKEPYARTAYPHSINGLTNQDLLYGVPGMDLFNSFVTMHQNHSCTLYGGRSTGNFIETAHDLSPVGNMLAAVRYTVIPQMVGSYPQNIDYHSYLGKLDTFYIFENPQSLSLGFYVPDEAKSLSEYLQCPPELYNRLASLYTDSDDPLFTFQEIHFSRDMNAPDSFCFTDEHGKQMEPDDAYAIYSAEDDFSEIGLGRLHLRFHYTPVADGDVYLYAAEMVEIGHAHAGEETVADVVFPNQINGMTNQYILRILHEDVLNAFYEKAKENQLENIVIKNDTITGTTNYEQDGYTMLSLAYDKSWHAYLDGVETEIEDPYDAVMFIKTPAGRHTLTLKYIPYGMHLSKGISLGFWILTACIYTLKSHIKKRRKKLSPSE